MKKIPFVLSLLLCVLHSVQAQVMPDTTNQGSTLAISPLDTLRSKRNLLSTAVYQGDVKLRPKSVLALYQEDPTARRHFKFGRALLPVGPLVSLAGIGVTAIALKGTPGSRVITVDKQRVTAQYITRSQVKFAAGIGLFLGGIALAEVANELIGNSVIRFNGRLKNPQATLHFGVTSGGVGVAVKF